MVISVVSSPARCRSEVTFPAYGCGIRSPSSHADPARPKMSVQVTVTPSLASTPCTWSLQLVRSRTSLILYRVSSLSSRTSCGLLVIFAVPRRRPSSVIRTSTLRRRCRSIPTTCRPSYAVSIGGLPFLVETDALQLPASAREREAPLLHRISLGGWGVRDRGRGLAVRAGRAWFLIFCEPARRVALVTDRRLCWSAVCVRYAACAPIWCVRVAACAGSGAGGAERAAAAGGSGSR